MRVMSSAVMLLGFALFATPVRAHAQSANARSAQEFDRADRRSRQIIWTMQNAQRTAAARQQGLFGPVDSIGRRGQILLIQNRPVGVFFDADTLFAQATKVSAVDLQAQSRFLGALDTASLLAVSRAVRTAQVRGASAFRDASRQYTPVAIRFEEDTIEVWLVPVTSILQGPSISVGGEVGFVFSPDGRNVIREINDFGKYRLVTQPESGPVHIQSGEQMIPTLTEMLVANGLKRSGRDIWIDMKEDRVMLTGPTGNEAWVHVGMSH